MGDVNLLVTKELLFEQWWVQNKKNKLFDAQFNRLKRSTKKTDAQIWYDLKSEIYDDCFLGRTSDGTDNDKVAARISSTKKRTDFTPPIIKTKDSTDHESVATKLDIRCDAQKQVNEDGHFIYPYAQSQELNDFEIRLALLQTCLQLMKDTEGKNEGAVMTVVFVSKQKIYVLGIGDAPAYLYDESTNTTKILNRSHDHSDQYEAEDFLKRGGEFAYGNRAGGLMEVTRSLGDCMFPGIHGGRETIYGVSGLPSLSVVDKPKNGEIILCTDGVSKVYDPIDITPVITAVKNNGGDIAATIVESVHPYANDDVTARHIHLQQTHTLIGVVDGHGQDNKNIKNPVVDIIEKNAGLHFENSVNEIKVLSSQSCLMIQNDKINNVLDIILLNYNAANAGYRYKNRRFAQIEALQYAKNSLSSPAEKMAIINAVLASLKAEDGTEMRRFFSHGKSRLEDLIKSYTKNFQNIAAETDSEKLANITQALNDKYHSSEMIKLCAKIKPVSIVLGPKRKWLCC
jgi:serine/threonine protein phosphatase PrpC